ncbi:MAG: sigma-70 family RNA polymerase sigma factor [Planctomycetes bacterium]|nr:sigma-70 family RNA polymerase sigma factor [Planctomycetota bacterium]MBL7146920.1 sigma-70 family RNA polymerase sigma factor [Phycisphaerae bacterium]
MLEDKLLLWRFKHGSREAFRLIYQKYADGLLTLAANLLNDKADAEDVVQDVFISFVRSVQKFHLRGSLKSYLATCVANRSRDYIRKNRRRQTLLVNQAEQSKTMVKNPVQLMLRSEQLQKLSYAITELPYEQREVLILRLHGKMRFKAIAKLQNISVKTVQSRYRYGLDKLRSILNNEVKR